MMLEKHGEDTCTNRKINAYYYLAAKKGLKESFHDRPMDGPYYNSITDACLVSLIGYMIFSKHSGSWILPEDPHIHQQRAFQ